MTLDPALALADVEHAAVQLREAQADIAELDAARRAAIRRAIVAGCSRADIAQVAGITRGRVTQIEQGRR